MEANSLPPDPKAPVVYDSDALERVSVNDNVTVADLSNAPQNNYPIEALEVRDEGNAAHAPTNQPPPQFSSAGMGSVPFSRRRAATVSLGITIIVIIFTGAIMGVLVKGRIATKEATNRDVPTQGITLEQSGTNANPVELKDDQQSLLVSGDIITRGELRVSAGGFVTTLRSQPLTSNQTISLPAASGTICLDSNNCNFVSQTQLAAVQGQIVEATTINTNSGDITLQGTENQVSVTTNGQTVTFTTPQNLHTAASIQFANLRLSGTLRTDTIRTHTTGGDLTVTADTDQIFFVDRSRTFSFPTGGLAAQTICTSQNNCNYGTGNGDIVNGGQIGPIVIGTNDASTLQFETNNTTRIALQSNGNIAMDTGTLFVDAVNGRVGIGTTTPSVKLSVTGGSMIVEGTHGGGNGITVTGAGTRMFFDANRSAFRTGAVSGSQWDNANVGSYSFAGGRNSTASGSYSFAYGENANAQGQNSIALGAATYASNPFALAVGFDSETNGMASQVLGYGLSMRTFAGMATGYCNYSSGSQNTTSWASADQLFVIGNGTYDAGISDCSLRQNALEMTKNGNLAVDTNTFFVDATNNRVGIGTATPTAKLEVSGGSLLVTGTHTGAAEITVTGDGTRMFFDVGRSAFRAGAAVGNSWDPDWMGLHSAAFGQNTRASQWGFAAGQSTTAASQAVAFGAGTNASGTASSALGWNTTAQAFGSMAIGQCNVAQGTTGSLVSTDTAFAVGNGTYNGGTQSCDSRSNAFQVAYNGSTTVNGGSMLVQGTHGGGNGISVTGAGTRMFFDVNKSAFRAGSTTTNFFDDANVGQYSFAAGNNAFAIGNGSAALGIASRADWDNAMAFGFNARGAGAQAMAIGYYTQSQAYASTALGVCNAYSGATSSWNATDQLFAIGNGTLNGLGLSCATRQNALEMTKNGNLAVDTNTLYVDAVNNRVGIGTATPVSKLEVVESSADTTAASLAGANITVTDTGVVTSGTDSTSGLSVSVTRTGATGGTIQTFGGTFIAIGDTGGSSTAVGVQALGANADDSMGVQGFGFISGSGARNSAIGVNGVTGTYFASSPTITTAYGLQGSVAMDLGVATITNAAGLNIKTATNIAGGTITNNYGIRVENQTAGASDYGLYIEGADTYALWVDSGASRLDGTLAVAGHSAVGAHATVDGATISNAFVDTADMSNVLTVAEDITDFSKTNTSGILSVITANPTSLYAGTITATTSTLSVGGSESAQTVFGTVSALTTSDSIDVDTVGGTYNMVALGSSGDVLNIAVGEGNVISATSNITGVMYGSLNQVTASGTGGGVAGGVYQVDASGDSPLVAGITVSNGINGGTVADQRGMVISLQSQPAATITTSVGLDISTVAHSGTVTDSYGVRVGASTGATNNYGVYVAGGGTYAVWVDDGVSRFDGNVGINATAAPNTLNLNTLTTADAAAQLAVSTDGTTNKGVVVQGVASQSADLFQAQDSTGAVLASISAAGDLTVETATINGTLTVNGNATINGHVISGNTSGSTTAATGAAADCSASGLANISGNDTAGTITITTSTGVCAAGTLATITFANAYGSAPEVVITPKDANGASLQYYNGSATTAAFTIDTGVGATASTVYTYSYHVIE